MGCDECLLTLIHAHHTHAHHKHAQIAINRIKTEKDKTRLMFLGYNITDSNGHSIPNKLGSE